MKLKLLAEDFSICRLSDYKAVDWTAPLVFILKSTTEITVVCPTVQKPAQTLSDDDGWRGFCIDGKLNYELVGIVAKISQILASHTISVFVVSGIENNYFFVKNEQLALAQDALDKKGYFFV